MGFGVLTEVEGTTRVERVCEKLAMRMSPEGLSETYMMMMEELEKYYSDKFSANWPGFKHKADSSMNPEDQLVVTGALEASLTEKGENSVREIMPNGSGFRFGTRVFYAHFVNDGTKNMQERPFMKLTKPVEQLLISVVAERTGLRPDLRYKSGFAPAEEE